MFGSEARIGLTSSSLPNGLMSTIKSEDDLFAVFEETQKLHTSRCSLVTWTVLRAIPPRYQNIDMKLPLLNTNKPRGLWKEVESISKQEPSATMLQFLSLQLIEADVMQETFGGLWLTRLTMTSTKSQWRVVYLTGITQEISLIYALNISWVWMMSVWTTQFLYMKLCQASLHLEVKASSSATAVVPSVATQITASVSRQN